MAPRATLSIGKEPSLHNGEVSTSPLSEPPGMLQRFRDLRQHLDQTRHRLWRFKELDAHVRFLEETIFSLDGQQLVSEMFLSGLAPELIALHQLAYCRWETELEHRFVESLNASPSIDNYALAQRFRRLIAHEVDLLRAPVPKRLLFIGSGPVPISAILYNEMLGIRVDCVDADIAAVDQSRELLKRLSLSNQVHVHRSDGAEVDASCYDAVVIALLAKPKSDILSQLARSVRPDCQIICRTSQGLRVLVYEPMDVETDLVHFRIVDQRHAQKGDTISSLKLALTGSISR